MKKHLFTLLLLMVCAFASAQVDPEFEKATGVNTYEGEPTVAPRTVRAVEIGWVRDSNAFYFYDRTDGIWKKATANGEQGGDGNTIISGYGTPDNSLGVPGDYYLDTDTYRIFGPKAGGVWGVGRLLIGPEGPEGPAGAGVVIVGTVETADSLPMPYTGAIGDMFIAEDTGFGHVYNDGGGFTDVGAIRGPKGDKGDVGDAGPQGQQGIAGNNGNDGQDGNDGADGVDGQSATLTVGTTTNSAPGGDASVTNSGTSSAAIFDFVIPRGQTGPQGDGWTSGTYNASTGVLTFLSNDGLGFATGDLRGADGVNGQDGTNGSAGVDGNGIASTSYNASTGVLTFTFDDASTFSTGDLRGEDGGQSLAISGRNLTISNGNTVALPAEEDPDYVAAASATQFNLTTMPRVDFADESDWQKPSGYSGFVDGNGLGSVGAPEDGIGYFTVIANRDSGGGMAGIWFGRLSKRVYFGRADAGSFPTWTEVYSTENTPPIDGVQAISEGFGVDVDPSDPANPIVSADTTAMATNIDVEIAQASAEGYAKERDLARSRSYASVSANLSYKIGVDTFPFVHVVINGDSKSNRVATPSATGAALGDVYGYAGPGYISLSTYNNGRLGVIPRATSSTRVEYPATDFAKYSMDGQAQELTGTGEVRIETNSGYTAYTSDSTCTWWDSALLSYLRHPGGGDIEMWVDDVQIATLNANGTEAKLIYKLTGLADTSHTLKIVNSTGTNYTLDAFLWRSEAKGIIVSHVANSGYDASNFTSLFAADNKQMIDSFPPDLVMVRLGTNDSNRDFDPNVFAGSVAEIADTFLNSNPIADVLLMGIEGVRLTSAYQDEDYNTALKDTATARFWGFASLFDVVPSMADFQDRGFTDDAVHENAKGSHLIGNFIANAILKGGDQSGGGSGGGDQNLQSVTDIGATTNNPVTINSYLELQDALGNVRIGDRAGESLTTGTFNMMRGEQAGLNTTTGGFNLFDGYQAGFRNTTGEKNVVGGVQSLFNNRTGSENFGQGAQAGQLTADGSPLNTTNQSIYFGASSRAAYDNPVNENVFGYGAIGNGSNSFTFGNDNTDSTFLKGAVHLNEDLDAEGNKLTNLADPTLDQDAATKAYVDGQSGGGGSQWTTTGSDIYYNTGFVGIGTDSPTSDLHVSSPTLNAEARIEAGQFATFYISSDLSGTGDRDPTFRFATEGVERWRVGVDQSNSNGFSISNGSLGTSSSIFIRESNGYVGIFQNPSRELDVDGRVRVRNMPLGSAIGVVGFEADGDLSEYPLGDLIDGNGIEDGGTVAVPIGTQVQGFTWPSSGAFDNRSYYGDFISGSYRNDRYTFGSNGLGYERQVRFDASGDLVGEPFVGIYDASFSKGYLKGDRINFDTPIKDWDLIFDLSQPRISNGTDTDYEVFLDDRPDVDGSAPITNEDGSTAWRSGMPIQYAKTANTSVGTFPAGTFVDAAFPATSVKPGDRYEFELIVYYTTGASTDAEIRIQVNAGSLSGGYVNGQDGDVLTLTNTTDLLLSESSTEKRKVYTGYFTVTDATTLTLFARGVDGSAIINAGSSLIIRTL